MTSSPNRFSSFLSRFSRRALVVGVLVGGAVGCQPELEGLESGVEETWAVVTGSLRVANSLTTRALVFNAITTNPTALEMITASGLQGLFPGDTYLQRQLVDTDARAVMSYVVSCALDAGSTVNWMAPTTPSAPAASGTWRGQLGLCPEWKTSTPSLACLSRVSACLLARNNAMGRRVELSLRGEDITRPTLFSLEGVSAPVQYDPATDLQVPSFVGCTGASSSTSRDCGWKGDGIGRCIPGQQVRLGAGAPAPDLCGEGPVLGSATGSAMMLRVCADIAGCDHGSTRRLALGVASCSTPNPSVSFTCPASGYFNVLKQTVNTWQTGTVVVQEEEDTLALARYPLPEAEVFTLREGAYYGNIFDSKALGAKVSVGKDFVITGKEENVRGSVYRRMYSCQAPGWSDAAAYAANRLCALPSSGSNCAAISTGTCVNPTAPAYPSSRCATADGALVAGDMDYEKCRDTAGDTWSEPITVFLHGACDLMGKGTTPAACRRETGVER